DDLAAPTGSDIDITNSSGATTVSWTAATDPAPASGVQNYDWCINDAADCSTPNRSGTVEGTTADTGAAPPLADSTQYPGGRTRDNAGNLSAYACSDDFVVDTTNPTNPTGVIDDYDPAPGGVDIDFQTQNGSTTIAWTASTDIGGTGIKNYDWCINDAADCTT